MANRLVIQPDGRLALYCDVVDRVTVYNMTEEQFIEEQAGEAARAARQAAREWIDGRLPGRRRWTTEEIVATVRRVHGDVAADEDLRRLTDPAFTEPEE